MKKYCPFSKSKCQGDKCALFVGNKCALVQIAISALAIAESVDCGFGGISKTFEVCEQDIYRLGLNKELGS